MSPSAILWDENCLFVLAKRQTSRVLTCTRKIARIWLGRLNALNSSNRKSSVSCSVICKQQAKTRDDTLSAYKKFGELTRVPEEFAEEITICSYMKTKGIM